MSMDCFWRGVEIIYAEEGNRIDCLRYARMYGGHRICGSMLAVVSFRANLMGVRE